MAQTVFNLATHRHVRNRRGQPIIFLGVIVGVWILGRFISYVSDADPAGYRPTSHIHTKTEVPTALIPMLSENIEGKDYSRDWHYSRRSAKQLDKRTLYIKYAKPPPRIATHKDNAGYPAVSAQSENYFPEIYPPTEFSPDRRAPSNSKRATLPVPGLKKPAQSQYNWSLQNWALVRPGGTNTIAAGNGQYGGSQIGAVLRYTPDPDERRRPELYARFSTALSPKSYNRFDDAEIAFGFSARPVRTIPVAIAVEQRIAIGKNARTRPAAYAVTQIPSFELPTNARGSFYAQAGAAGIKNTQYFYDTQLLAEKPVATIGKIEISAGSGIWSGGQTGQNSLESDIYRLDAGPRVSAAIPLGAGHARLSIDYRARLAGNAEPGSGLAATLSTDF